MFNFKYDIVIESCIGEEASSYEEYGGLTYGSIMAVGNNLDELLKNASIVLINYDGDEVREIKCDEEWMIQLIIKEYANALNSLES